MNHNGPGINPDQKLLAIFLPTHVIADECGENLDRWDGSSHVAAQFPGIVDVDVPA